MSQLSQRRCNKSCSVVWLALWRIDRLGIINPSVVFGVFAVNCCCWKWDCGQLCVAWSRAKYNWSIEAGKCLNYCPLHNAMIASCRELDCFRRKCINRLNDFLKNGFRTLKVPLNDWPRRIQSIQASPNNKPSKSRRSSTTWTFHQRRTIPRESQRPATQLTHQGCLANGFFCC